MSLGRKRLVVIGAGFSGAVVARALAEDGHKVLVIDERDHVGGNCHTAPDPQTGIMVHVYGPHIFHTDSREIWDYMNRFAEMMPYINRVKATAGGRIYSLPINLHSINQLFDTALSPDEAKMFIASLCRSDIAEPRNFEEQALKFVGEKIYHTFFHGYTRKQWGVDPSTLPASILKRLPVRFNYDDNYFSHRYQGIPREGYTNAVKRILDHPNIQVRLGSNGDAHGEAADHVLYSGQLDRFFGYDLGRLEYRTLRFERFTHPGDFQGTAVMNYCDEEVPYTRISEHRHFAPWHRGGTGQSVCFREFSSACGQSDTPFYPLRLATDKALLADYVARARRERNVTFIGRLGTYSYLDMDVTIARALKTARVLQRAWHRGETPPVFVHNP